MVEPDGVKSSTEENDNADSAASPSPPSEGAATDHIPCSLLPLRAAALFRFMCRQRVDPAHGASTINRRFVTSKAELWRRFVNYNKAVLFRRVDGYWPTHSFAHIPRLMDRILQQRMEEADFADLAQQTRSARSRETKVFWTTYAFAYYALSHRRAIDVEEVLEAGRWSRQEIDVVGPDLPPLGPLVDYTNREMLPEHQFNPDLAETLLLHATALPNGTSLSIAALLGSPAFGSSPAAEGPPLVTLSLVNITDNAARVLRACGGSTTCGGPAALPSGASEAVDTSVRSPLVLSADGQTLADDDTFAVAFSEASASAYIGWVRIDTGIRSVVAAAPRRCRHFAAVLKASDQSVGSPPAASQLGGFVLRKAPGSFHALVVGSSAAAAALSVASRPARHSRKPRVAAPGVSVLRGVRCALPAGRDVQAVHSRRVVQRQRRGCAAQQAVRVRVRHRLLGHRLQHQAGHDVVRPLRHFRVHRQHQAGPDAEGCPARVCAGRQRLDVGCVDHVRHLRQRRPRRDGDELRVLRRLRGGHRGHEG